MEKKKQENLTLCQLLEQLRQLIQQMDNQSRIQSLPQTSHSLLAEELKLSALRLEEGFIQVKNDKVYVVNENIRPILAQDALRFKNSTLFDEMDRVFNTMSARLSLESVGDQANVYAKALYNYHNTWKRIVEQLAKLD